MHMRRVRMVGCDGCAVHPFRKAPAPFPTTAANLAAASQRSVFPGTRRPTLAHPFTTLVRIGPGCRRFGSLRAQSRSSSLIEVLERVFASTRLTITAQYR